MSEPMKNEYLEQVKAQQQQVEVDLRAQRAAAPMTAAPADGVFQAESRSRGGRQRLGGGVPETLSAAVNVRITGIWRWKTVVVPPNAYVVHTRRGYEKPLHLGLGISFRFNPFSDSFIVVPSTMQTILISASCICKEMQGLFVQGYVQWIIADFATAYKKLDFTDAVDPMRVVNVQLREQAEAAIKDKVATMGINEVLSDKQPIIEELTARLRQVAEGEGGTDTGLGLRIVTVQVKEAVVSSARLWENMQKPFRSERERVARLAELDAQTIIKAQEVESERASVTAQLESENQIGTIRAEMESTVFDREQMEKTRRHQKEQEVARFAIQEKNQTAKLDQQGKREFEEAAISHALTLAHARRAASHQEQIKDIELRMAQSAREIEAAEATSKLEQVRLEKENQLAQLKLQEQLKTKELQTKAELALREAGFETANRQIEMELGFEAARRKMANEMSEAQLQAHFVDALPAIAEKLPKPKEFHAVSIGSAGSTEGQALVSLITQILAVLDVFRTKREPEQQ